MISNGMMMILVQRGDHERHERGIGGCCNVNQKGQKAPPVIYSLCSTALEWQKVHSFPKKAQKQHIKIKLRLVKKEKKISKNPEKIYLAVENMSSVISEALVGAILCGESA